jgi:hypothetical protein
MKYAIFSLVVVLGVPAMTWLAMADRRFRQWLLALLIVSTCFGMMGKINFVSLETYRGPDRGFEITLTDLIALSLNIALIAKFRSKLLLVPPRTILVALFMLWCAISIVMSPVPLYGAFTFFKLLRICAIYWCVVNVLEIGTPLRGLWLGITGISIIMTVLALKQKYINGYYRVPGPFDHSNTIPLFVNLIIPVLLIWALADKNLKLWESILALVGSLGMLFCVVATYSRAGIALSGLSLLIALAATNFRGLNPRALVVSGVVMVLMLLGAAKATDSIVNRVKTAPKSSEEARKEFNAAAHQMLADHHGGVGLNNFSYVLTNRTSYNRFLKVMKNESQAGVCHHIYNLTAAELGYPGLVMFLLLITSFCWTSVRSAFRSRSFESKLLFGFFLGALALHLQGFLEWGFRITPVMQMFAMTSAMIIGLARIVERKRVEEQTYVPQYVSETVEIADTPEEVLS